MSDELEHELEVRSGHADNKNKQAHNNATMREGGRATAQPCATCHLHLDSFVRCLCRTNTRRHCGCQGVQVCTVTA